MLFGSNVTFEGGVVHGAALRAQNQTTSGQLSASTKKLFKAIDDENLENFKQALAEGVDINVFDEGGMTPLMSIASIYIASNNQPALEEMAKLLIQKRSININAQSKQPVYKEIQKKDRFGRLLYLFRGEEVAETRPSYYIYCNSGQPVDNIDDQGIRRYFSYEYDGVKENVRTSEIQKNTVLHISCQVGARDIVKILLTHPDIKTDIENRENKSPEKSIERGSKDVIELEFKKVQKGKDLLNALSRKNIYQASILLNQEFNPNCWKRLNGEIETPLSLIIKSCLEGITQDNEGVLTKLLKHKELDFSQVKPIQAIEQNPQLKQIIEQAIKERLTNTIDKKDLDDVKKLVEDNYFINRAIVTAALRNVNNPIESIKNYLNEEFPASVEQPSANGHNVDPEINDKLIAQELQQLENFRDELERTKAQLTEKEREIASKTNKILQLEKDLRQVRQEKSIQQTRINTLTREKSQLENLRGALERTKAQLAEKEQELADRIVSERTKDINKISQLERVEQELQAQNQDLKNKNRKLSEATIYNRRQSNYASAFFVLSGAFAIGTCLTISNLAICIPLAVATFVFLTIGCYCSYKANTVLSDVTSTQFGNVVNDLRRS